jgi:hypothetical protein
VPQLWRLVADFPPQRSGVSLGSGHVGLVVDKVEVGQVLKGQIVADQIDSLSPLQEIKN